MVSRALGIISARPTHPIFHGIDPFLTGRKCKQWWNLREDRSIILSGFYVTLIRGDAWRDLIINVSEWPDYCCSANSIDFLTRRSDTMHASGSIWQEEANFADILFTANYMRIITRTNCKRKLWALAYNRMRMSEPAYDYLSSRNRLSATKIIINKTTSSTRKLVATCECCAVHLFAMENHLTNY